MIRGPLRSTLFPFWAHFRSCTVSYTWLEDKTGPVITGCPTGPITLACNARPTCADAKALVTPSDGCGGAVTLDCADGGVQITGCQGSETFTLTATDLCGNQS